MSILHRKTERRVIQIQSTNMYQKKSKLENQKGVQNTYNYKKST